MVEASDYTGLILVSGADQPGITTGLMETLAPFSIAILDMDQIVTRGRLIQTTLISLNRDHAPAIEADLLAFSKNHNLDLAIDFTELPRTSQFSGEDLILRIVAPKMAPAALATCASVLSDIGGNILEIRRIADRPLVAFELRVSIVPASLALEELQRTITSQIAPLGATAFITSSHHHPGLGQIVMLDVDSTLIDQEVIDQIAGKFGVGDQVSAITESAMRGELDFETSLRERVALLAGAPATILDEVKSEITLTAGVRTLIETIHARGGKVGVVSGGFSQVINPLSSELGLDFARANTLEIINGKITGQLLGPIITRAGKAEALKEFAERSSVPISAAIAIGDGANDLDMLSIAGLGIAFNAKPAVQEATDIAINFRDLTSVLYLLGISQNEVSSSL